MSKKTKDEAKHSSGNILTLKYDTQGEGIWQHSIPVEPFKEFLKKHINEDVEALIEDALRIDNPITICLVTPEEDREACINGLIWGEGCSRKWAEREVDGVPHPEGVEPSDEEEEN